MADGLWPMAGMRELMVYDKWFIGDDNGHKATRIV